MDDVLLKDYLKLGAGAVIGGLAGVGLAWLLTSMHVVSPDDIATGAGLGIAGVLIGFLVMFARIMLSDHG